MEGRKMTKHAPNMPDEEKRKMLKICEDALQKATVAIQRDTLKRAIKKLKEDLEK